MALDPAAEAEVQADARKLIAQTGGDVRQLAVIAAQYKRFAAGAQPGALEVSGGVSAATGEPFVRFAFGGDYAIQQKPQEAREFALVVLEAAETAVADAAIFKWAGEVLEWPRERAAQVVGHIRDFRRDRWGGEPANEKEEPS